MSCDLLVLRNHATNFCEGGFNKFSIMELFIFLLNYCDKESIRNFMINHRNEDPDVHFEQRISVCDWFETQDMLM